jgi:hypothetical protein
MRIDGEWLLCDDNVLRPIIRGEILTGHGFWEPAEFLSIPVQTALCSVLLSWQYSVSKLLRPSTILVVWEAQPMQLL